MVVRCGLKIPSWGKPRDAKQLSWVREFSICTEQPLWILFVAYSFFDNCIQAWTCVILSIIHWNNYIFQWRDAQYGSYLRHWRWRQNVWRKIDVNMTSRRQKCQNFKIAILKSCMRVSPRVIWHFTAPVRFTGIPVGYSRILVLQWNRYGVYMYLRIILQFCKQTICCGYLLESNSPTYILREKYKTLSPNYHQIPILSVSQFISYGGIISGLHNKGKDQTLININGLPHDKTNKMICALSKDSDQPGHLYSLIWVFTVRSMSSWGPNVSSCGQRRLWSDWADAQADLSLHCAQRSFCWFCHEAAYFMF